MQGALTVFESFCKLKKESTRMQRFANCILTNLLGFLSENIRNGALLLQIIACPSLLIFSCNVGCAIGHILGSSEA